jgi:hypothetical protein
MSTEETAKPEAQFRCKICLEEFKDEASYDRHIGKFVTDEDYAEHISERPPEE